MVWDLENDVFSLMCGHGLSLNGAWDCGCAYGRYNEADLMLAIVKVAVKYLRNSGVKVLTDADRNNNRNMVSCVGWANIQRAKLYMSVHCDYQLASKGVAPLYVSKTGKKMAKAIGKSIAKDMGMKWKGTFKRPDLYELSQTDMPAVILETGAIKADLKYLKDYEKYGKALAKGICKYIGVEFKVTKKPAQKSTESLTYGGKLPTKMIGYGSRGADVEKWQKFLKWAIAPSIEVDGIFGEGTEKWTKSFQKKTKIEIDGIEGEQTIRMAKKYKK